MKGKVSTGLDVPEGGMSVLSIFPSFVDIAGGILVPLKQEFLQV